MPLDVERLASLINDACENLEEVSVKEVLDEALKTYTTGFQLLI